MLVRAKLIVVKSFYSEAVIFELAKNNSIAALKIKRSQNTHVYYNTVTCSNLANLADE